jgi:hypothetical protein
MAEDLSACEKSRGLDSLCLDGDSPAEIQAGVGADVHVIHGHIPDSVGSGVKTVFVAHGTPEVCFTQSITASYGGHGASDSIMQSMYRVKTSDAVVTFWPRHQAIWQSMSDKGRMVDCVPMGIDKSKWQRKESRGKWVGEPSLLTAENCFEMKWPLDLLISMAWVMDQLKSMRLHCFHIPLYQTRWWSALTFANGTAYRSFMESSRLDQPDLLNAFCSIDYYIGLVRYGDHNRICLEAHAVGCPVISFRGNEYADYWIDEGDQRVIAAQLLMILKGNVPKRQAPETPDISETAASMAKIYERIL